MKKVCCIVVIFLLFYGAMILSLHKSWAYETLMVYWKLDETTTGATVVDSSGNGYNATPNSNPSPDPEVPTTIKFSDPRSLHFNGSQSVSIPDNSAFALTDATFSVWVKFDSIPSDANMIAKRSSNPGGTQVQWQFGYNKASNRFKVTLANGGDTCCTDFHYAPSPAISTGTWYHIAVSINNTTKKLRWYQNGLFKEEDDITGTNLGTQISAPLTLGASFAGTSEQLVGNLDDVRIYNSVLSDPEIAIIAEGEEGPGVSVPTPTPSPTPSSSPTPTSSPQSTPIVQNLQNILPPSCTALIPSGTPDLFQIDVDQTHATLFFAPASGDVTDYAISYGYTSGDERFSTFTNQGSSTGVLSYTVNALSPNLTYYFKVRPLNDCMSGNWSNEMKITTPITNTIDRYYKNFIAKLASILPQKRTVLSSTMTNTKKVTECQTYMVLPGESLWKIAQDNFGDGTKYPLIQSSNNLKTINLKVGQKLIIGC